CTGGAGQGGLTGPRSNLASGRGVSPAAPAAPSTEGTRGMAATPKPPGPIVEGDTSTMPTPTKLNDTTAVLTERGHLARMLFRLRDRIRTLGAADRAWAADALVLLLAECHPAAATGKG